jgi:hypothetical protein
MVNAWVIGLLGIWMVITPFATMSLYANTWNDWIVGVVAAILGFAMAGDKTWQGSISGVVGIWLFISGFIPVLRVGNGLLSNDLAMGVLLIIAGFAATRHQHPMIAPPHGAH